jgi:hypothetical protein
MLDWEDLHANQLRCAELHVCTKHKLYVPVWHSLHCTAGCAYLEGCTCVNFCVSSLQVTACSSSFLVTEHCSPDQHFSLSLVTASSCDSRYVCQQAPTCHQLFAPKKSAKQRAYLLQRALHQHIQVVQLWYGLQTLLSPSTVLCTSKHCVYCAAVTCLPDRSNSGSLQ